MKNIWLIFKHTASRSILMMIISAVAAVVMLTLITAPEKKPEENEIGLKFGNSTVRVGIIDYDESPLSEDLKTYFTECLGMETEEEKNYDFQADMLIDRKISAIIEVPQGFYSSAAAGKMIPLTITTLDDYENVAFIEVYAESYMRSAEVISSAAKGNEDTFLKMLSSDVSGGSVSAVEMSVETDAADKVRVAFCLVEGFMMMSMMGVLFFISSMILSDRLTGVYSRTVCSVIKPLEYVVGIGLFGVICCSAMSLVVTLYIFGTNDSIGIPIWVMILVNELFVLFSVGTAIMFALLVKGRQTLFAIDIGYTTLGCMLGGAWFPIADGLGAVGHIAKFLPQYWVMDLVR
ncbi:MAG: ABC transporter permease, partial [Oscillospiraceae bacterium]|nr:ABC transporter permease [Oscillospiraceae bacterium]